GQTIITITWGGADSYQTEPLVQAYPNLQTFLAPDGVTAVISQSGGGSNTNSAQDFPNVLNQIAGDIKFSAVSYGSTMGPRGASLLGNQESADQLPQQTILFAAVAAPNFFFFVGHEQAVQYMWSDDGGADWQLLTTPAGMADLLGGSNGFSNGEGGYSLAVVADPSNYQHVIIAGVNDGLTGSQGPATGPWETVDGGVTWIDIGTDINGNSPQVDAHTLAFDTQAQSGNQSNTLVVGNVLMGTDGGIWKFNDILSVVMTNQAQGGGYVNGAPVTFAGGG